MAYFEGAYEQTTHRLARFDLRFDAIDRELELMSDSLRGEIEALRNEQSHRFTWTVGLIFGTWATAIITILAAVVHR